MPFDCQFRATHGQDACLLRCPTTGEDPVFSFARVERGDELPPIDDSTVDIALLDMPALGRSLLASGWRRAFPPAAACMAALALGLALAVPAPAQIRLDDSDQASAARARYDAIRALREGRYDDVLALLAAVPSDPDVLFVRGRVLALTGKYDLAQSAFEAAAARRPASEAALELGRLHLTLGRTAEGRRALEPVIAAGLHSDLGEVIGRAARAAQLLGRYEQANNLFRDAAALIGDDAELQIACSTS